MHRTSIAIPFACLAIVLSGACSSSSPRGSGEGGQGGAGGASLGGTGGGTTGAGGATGGATGGTTGTGGVKGGTGGSTIGTGGAVGGTVGSGGLSSQGGAPATGGSSASTVAVACAVPAEAGPESTTGATVVGDGTPASCTAAAFETAVQKGGVTFNCGPGQVTITLTHQIKLLNNAGPDGLGHRVIDGGSKVTLSGGNWTRLLYQDACDQSLGQVAGDCTNSPNPSLVIQNLALANTATVSDSLGGGAIYVRGGRLKVFFSSFCQNSAGASGAQLAGGAIYAEHAYGQVYIVNSLFGGNAGCVNGSSNGGNLGGISTSFTVVNSQLTYGGADGFGGIPPAPNTPGGGYGGAIYAHGNGINLTICGSTISNNEAVEVGGAIFYSADDLLGSVRIDRSLFKANPGKLPVPSPGRAENGVFLQTATANISITNSTFN
jgi:hypothetical protein